MANVTPFANLETKIAENLRWLDANGQLGPGLQDPGLQSILSGFCSMLSIPDTVNVGVLYSDKTIIDVPNNAIPMTMQAVTRQVTQQVGMPSGSPPFSSFVAALCADVQAEIARDVAQLAAQQETSPWKLSYHFHLMWMPVPITDSAPLLATTDVALIPPASDVALTTNVWNGRWVMKYGKAVYIEYVAP